MHTVKANHPKVSLQRICGLLNLTRQAHYQYIESRRERSIEEQIIVELVREQRKNHAVMGAVKLLSKIEQELVQNNIKIGRDLFYDVLWRNGLQTRRSRRKNVSFGSSKANNYENLMLGREITGKNQAVVVDFTYIKQVNGKYLYLCLISDAYSRYVLGWHLSSSIKSIDALKALKMATKTIGNCEGIIHHSDNGSQYLSKEYTDYLKSKGMLISTSAPRSPHENPMAERLHGVLKSEYLQFRKINNLQEGERIIREIIYLYNYQRPHYSISLKCPGEVYNDNLQVKKLWKNRRKKKHANSI